MEALIPIFRLLHFLGFSLLLGGVIASIVLVKKEGRGIAGIKVANTCMHLLAAPGLVLLILTGILHSSLIQWDNFKGAGYMHAKVFFVVTVFLLMIVDIRTQKKIIKGQFGPELTASLVQRRQNVASAMAALILLVMWLVSFRPF